VPDSDGTGDPVGRLPSLWIHAVWRRLVIVSPALSLMLVLGSVLVPPEGCSVVAVEEDGRAVAACTDPHTWFVYDPELTHDGLWSITHEEPPELAVICVR
jgi:hypothetical protein